MPQPQFLRCSRLTANGARTVARPLRDNHALRPEGVPSEFAAAIDLALDELGLEWEIDL